MVGNLIRFDLLQVVFVGTGGRRHAVIVNSIHLEIFEDGIHAAQMVCMGMGNNDFGNFLDLVFMKERHNLVPVFNVPGINHDKLPILFQKEGISLAYVQHTHSKLSSFGGSRGLRRTGRRGRAAAAGGKSSG